MFRQRNRLKISLNTRNLILHWDPLDGALSTSETVYNLKKDLEIIFFTQYKLQYWCMRLQTRRLL